MSDHPENREARRDDERRKTSQEGQLPIIRENEPRPVSVEHDSDEISDSLHDNQQEIVIDRQTQELLDSLDDEVEGDAKAVSTSTAVLLDELDKIKPQTVKDDDPFTPTHDRDSSDEINIHRADANPRESLDGVPDTLQDGSPTAPPTPAEEPVEAPPIYRYRVAAALSPAVEEMVSAALKSVDMGLPDSGLFEWQAPFRTEQPHAIASALDGWATQHLPISTRLERVHSEVIETQHYLAGWRLSNVVAIHAAQNALTATLAPLIEPEPDAPATFRPVLSVKANIPAEHLPALVGFLQRSFEEQDWTIEGIELLRAAVPDEEELAERAEEETEIDEWEVISTFKAGV